MPPVSRSTLARFCLAFVIMPFVNGLLSFLIHPLFWSIGPYEGAFWVDSVQAARSFAVSLTVIAMIMTGAGAIPALYWLLTGRSFSLRQVILAGVILGNAPFAVSAAGVVLFYLVGLATASDAGYVLVYGPMGAVRAIVIGSVLGAVSAATFWVVAILGTEYAR